MRIAFASKDNIHVNQHFGWCKEFYIYEIHGDEYTFVKSIDSSLEIDDEIEKLTYKIECLEDSDILYVQQIGPKAAMMVKKCQIFPMQSSRENEKIEDVLSSLIKMQENPPIWMRRLIAK
ncbi:NifB/NifX family molybdenum-iron cluster-binding protein [Arcobacter arenosus]|jgi:nitrogen fixation protein NifX|uniref:Dinitrogenase iron-molybdenum cofactor biosynthesis protein n=1 Tax=Arcobacter arenosus TaxID=2576037 RepID=A0A5R8Y2E3_9BACT|nr:NifB/NifX family molybdenum-iron cluster-binding protein [Arcobacter arenosus]TLP39346.1 dinitrogenase iron-molybdenum cofactor biosynthesis protein [Arcobacter arenosus]